MDISKFSQEELCEAYDIMNSWGWYDKFGEKPEGFDNMPNYRRTLMEKVFHVPTKEDYISSFCMAIVEAVPEKELLRYHHIHNLGRTDEEFEKWWLTEKIPFSEYDRHDWMNHSLVYEMFQWMTLMIAVLSLVINLVKK